MGTLGPQHHNFSIFSQNTFAKLLKTDACLLLLCNKNNNIIQGTQIANPK
jgi:hypothetical protein